MTTEQLPSDPKPRVEIFSEVLEAECGRFLCDVLYYPHDQGFLRRQFAGLSNDGKRLVSEALASAFTITHSEDLFVPGEWRCDRCSFHLHKRFLSSQDGSVGVDDRNTIEICPNHCVMHPERTPLPDSFLRDEVPLCNECHKKWMAEVEDELHPKQAPFYVAIINNNQATLMRHLTWREADKENSEGTVYLQGLFRAAVDHIDNLEAAWPSEYGMPLEPSSDWRAAALQPIPMLLFCPACGTQHIDAPEESCPIRDEFSSAGVVCGQLKGHEPPCTRATEIQVENLRWKNPPHKSHLCCNCKIVWRPADLPTTGVAEIRTSGSRDTWFPVGALEVKR